MDRPTFHELRGLSQVIQTRSDFLGGLVGKREGVDPCRVEACSFDQEPDPLDEAERLPCSWTCEHKRRTERRLDRRALRWGREKRELSAQDGDLVGHDRTGSK